MKKLLVVCVMLLTSAMCFAQSEVFGVWLNESGESQVEIKKEGSDYVGKVVWLKEPNNPDTNQPWLDNKNKDKSLQSRAVMGLPILHDFTYNAEEKEFEGGKIYDPRNGKNYTGKFWLNEDGNLSVRGYIGFLFATETWTRVK
ncbi:MAG: DUF2147 domain-containing protein [Mangrovibacterium sp.]